MLHRNNPNVGTILMNKILEHCTYYDDVIRKMMSYLFLNVIIEIIARFYSSYTFDNRIYPSVSVFNDMTFEISYNWVNYISEYKNVEFSSFDINLSGIVRYAIYRPKSVVAYT